MSSSSSAAVLTPLEEPGPSTSSKLFESTERRTLLSCLVLTVVVLVSYNPVTHNGFLNYDDDRYITDNPHVQAGLTWATAKWAFTTYDEANWAPLSWLSHALDFQLFGLNPLGHHYVSVLLHATNAVLLFLLLQGVTGFRWRSLMVAALFAVHPINVESVAWAAERKNVLSMLFFLLAFHAYVWYTRRPAVLRYAAVFCLFALALLSKSQIITFPFLLLLWDYWPLCRISPPPDSDAENGRPTNVWLVLEKVPLLLLSAASAMVTMNAEKAGGAVQTFSRYSLGLRLETAVISYVRYLGMALWPSKLVALYPHPTRLYPAWQVSAAVLLLMLTTAVVVNNYIRAASILRARDRRYLVVGWFWFLGSMVPMIGLVQVGPQALADRFAYLPFIGLFLMMTWLVADCANADKIPAKWLAIPAVCYLLVLATLTYRQVGYWRDTPTFWLRTLALTQDNYIAESNLGDFLFQHGRTEEAAVHFRAAIAILPDNLLANLNLGAYEESRGNLSAAIERYEMVVQRTADVDIRAAAYSSMGFDYRQMGQPVKAKKCFETAVQLAPHRTRAMVGLGLLAQENGNGNGDLAEAIRQYSRAVAVHPTDVTYWLLARALQRAGRLDEARAISERVENPAEAEKTAESFLNSVPSRPAVAQR
jgi:tetratricopeptide (TPR) repeat protein